MYVLRAKCSTKYAFAALHFVATVLWNRVSSSRSNVKSPVHFGSVQDLLKLSEFYKEVDKDSLSRFKNDATTDEYPISIENLDDYLGFLKNCFVYIRNHKSIDINLTNSPIVLSESEPLFYRDVGYFTTERIIVMQKQTKKTYFQNNTLKTFQDINCTSDFLFKNLRHSHSSYIGHCLGINHTKYVINSKPWSCQVHFDIFPPLYITNPSVGFVHDSSRTSLSVSAAQVDLWYFPHNLKQNLLKWTPSSMSPIKFNIIRNQDYEKWFHKSVYFDWIHRSVLSKRVQGVYTAASGKRVVPDMTSEIHITMLTRRINSTTKCNVTKVLALKSCFYCPSASNFITVTEISHFTWNSSLHPSKWLAVGNFFPTRGEMVGYQVTAGADIPNFSRCRNVETLQKIMNDNSSEPEFQLGVIHVVQLILKNISYEPGSLLPQCVKRYMPTLQVAKFLVNTRVEYFPGRDEYAMIKLSDEDNALTFLACGKSTPRQFSFNELVKVFEIEIWELILISMVLVTIVTAVLMTCPLI